MLIKSYAYGHIVEFVHICILSCTYFNRKHAHRHTHTRTHTDTITHGRTRTHTHAHTHVNMFILTYKHSSIYIQTVFSLACFLYCKGGNLYCTRVAPLYLFCIFLFLYVHLIYMPFCFLCWILFIHVLYFCSSVTCLYVFLRKNGHHFGGINKYI